MRVFVTGASGYVGGAATRSLVAAGHEVLGLARSEDAVRRVRAAGGTPVRGSLADAGLLAECARAADGVVHAAFDGDWAETSAAFEHERAVANLFADALRGTGRPYVFTSGAGLIGDTAAAVVDEDVVPSPPPEAALRIDAENDVLAAAADGVRSVVLRPGMTYGRAGSIIPTVMIQLAERFGGPVTVGDGRNAWSTVHIDDLGALYALAVQAAPAGAILHGANGDPVQLRAIAQAIARVRGRDEPVREWPLEEARVEYGMLAGFMAQNVRISAARARALGWRPAGAPLLEELERGSYASLIASA